MNLQAGRLERRLQPGLAAPQEAFQKALAMG